MDFEGAVKVSGKGLDYALESSRITRESEKIIKVVDALKPTDVNDPMQVTAWLIKRIEILGNTIYHIGARMAVTEDQREHVKSYASILLIIAQNRPDVQKAIATLSDWEKYAQHIVGSEHAKLAAQLADLEIKTRKKFTETVKWNDLRMKIEKDVLLEKAEHDKWSGLLEGKMPQSTQNLIHDENFELLKQYYLKRIERLSLHEVLTLPAKMVWVSAETKTERTANETIVREYQQVIADLVEGKNVESNEEQIHRFEAEMQTRIDKTIKHLVESYPEFYGAAAA